MYLELYWFTNSCFQATGKVICRNILLLRKKCISVTLWTFCGELREYCLQKYFCVQKYLRS